MNDKEKLEIWKRKLDEIESKLQKLSNEKNILANLLYEVKTRQNIKLNNSLKGLDLLEEINHLKDWIKFYEKESSAHKNKINALEIELSQQEILEQEFEDLDKESKSVQEKEKYEQEKSEETLDAEIPTLEELEKDVKKEEIKVEVDDELKLELVELEEDARMKSGTHSVGNLELEKPDFLVAVRQPIKEDEKEIAAITRLFEERPEIKAVREQIKELFKDKKDMIRPSWFKEKLTSIKDPINNAYKTFRSWKPSVSYNNKFVVYTVPVILLLLITGILFISEPEITGYVTVTQEQTYTDNLDLIINESGNYTWTTDKIGDIQSIKASGRVKGNGTVKIYIEKDGQRYLIYDNKENK